MCLEIIMKRFLSVLAASALLVTLTAVAVAQDTKDKAPPAKDKADKDAKGDKTPPAKDKADKDAKAPVVEAPKDATYYPLVVGNTWHYKIGDNHFLLRVAKFEKIGDLNCARIEMVADDKVASFEHIAVTKDGVVRVAYDDRKADPPLLFFKFPTKKGQEWTVNSVIGKTDKSPGEKVTGKFTEGVVDKVATPGGFSRNVITCTSNDLDANGLKLSFTYYFAENVGMIKQEIKVGDQPVVIELERFEPAK
jgi:hypothetical protein